VTASIQQISVRLRKIKGNPYLMEALFQQFSFLEVEPTGYQPGALRL